MHSTDLFALVILANLVFAVGIPWLSRQLAADSIAVITALLAARLTCVLTSVMLMGNGSSAIDGAAGVLLITASVLSLESAVRLLMRLSPIRQRGITR